MEELFYKLGFKKIIRRKKRLSTITLSLVLFLLIADMANAATYYSKASANFSLTSTWTADTAVNGNAASVGTADLYVIRNGHNVTLNATRTVGKVTIRSGGTMTMGGGNYTLTTPSPLIINLGGVLSLLIRTLTVAGSWTNDGRITGTSGIIQASTGTAINNGSINLSSGRVTMTGAGPLSNTGSIVLTTGQINRTTGTFTNSGTITMGAGTIVQTTGTLTNTASGVIDITGSATITFATGDFVNANTSANADFGSSAVTVTGTDASQNIGGFVTTGRFTCSKTSGTLTVNGDINCAGITKSGAGTGVLNLGTDNVINCSNTVILTAGTLNGGANTTLNVSVVSTTAWQGTASVFNPGTGTVNFSAAGNQTISATGTRAFHNLTFSGNGTRTNATTTVSNIYSLEGSSVPSAVPTGFVTLRYASTTKTAGAEWANTFTAAGGVIIDNGATVTINVAKIFNANIPLTIKNGGTLTTGSSALTLNGNFINDGIWTSSTGTVTVTGTATQSIGDFTTLGLFTMSKGSGTATMTGNAVAGSFTLNGAGTLDLGTGFAHAISGTFTRTNGIINGNTSTLNLGGTISGTGGSLTPGTGAVNLTGTGPQAVPNYTFYDLNFSGGGTKTLTGTTTVNHVLDISSPSEFNLSSFTLNLAGSGTPLINAGAFTASTSTVNYANSGLTTTNIAVLDYNNLNGTGGPRKFLTSGPIGIAGVFTPGAGAYDVTGSEVDFNGPADQNIPAFTFNKLTVSTSGIKKILAAVIVSCFAIDISDDASVEINADGGGRLNVIQ